jgi:DNA-directed RNA polymerase specialized sigma24 family protein
MRRLLLSRLSDEQLTRRLAAGEAAAFDELYRRYVQRLAVYGRQLLGDGAGGEGVAQVALLNAYRALRNGVVAA